MDNNSGRLPGLNGLRCLAAFSVMVCHIEQVKDFHSMENYFAYYFVKRLGPLGVTFFYVLSGFLITYLLLKEKKATGTIEIKRFYIRRALRIWPVYYFVVFLSFFIFPAIPWLDLANMPKVWGPDFFQKLGLFLLMSAHISQMYVSDLAYGSILGSASVEEHFYLIWPHILKKSGDWLAAVLIAIIVLWIFLKEGSIVPGTAKYFDSFRIDCMAIGALGALWPKPSFLFRREVQVVTFGALLYCVVEGLQFGLLDDTIYSFLFLMVILNVAGNPKSFLKLRNPFFEFMGKISYGLYAYQWICIAVAVKLVLALGISNGSIANLAVYYGAIGFTTGVAYLSYKYLEEPFLRKKAAV